MKTHIVQKTKQRFRHNTTKHFNFQNTWNCMGPLNEENKLHIDEKDNKTEKNPQSLKNVYHTL